jgi:hypothetical protein
MAIWATTAMPMTSRRPSVKVLAVEVIEQGCDEDERCRPNHGVRGRLDHPPVALQKPLDIQAHTHPRLPVCAQETDFCCRWFDPAGRMPFPFCAMPGDP